MRLCFSDEANYRPMPGEVSIFLAGPTPRLPEVPTWRIQAVSLLGQLNYSGAVLIPEHRERSGSGEVDYEDQVSWERAGMERASVIAFWVPRDLRTLPGFTTNVEFGTWLARSPERVLYGRPEGAPRTKYLDWLLGYEQSGLWSEYPGRSLPATSLGELLQGCVDLARRNSMTEKSDE